MRFAVIFGIYGVALGAIATAAGAYGPVLAWTAASCLLVATAYATTRPRLLGKRDDGTQRLGAVLLLAPYLAVQHVVWFLAYLRREMPPSQEVAPGIWLGRRPVAHEVPTPVRTVFDLTSEFHELAGVRTGRRYVALPTLDATAPPADALDCVASDVAAQPDPVLVHCAWGHGRSALVVACALVARGDAANVEDALGMIQAVRPRVRLNAAQRAALVAFVGRRSAPVLGSKP